MIHSNVLKAHRGISQGIRRSCPLLSRSKIISAFFAVLVFSSNNGVSAERGTQEFLFVTEHLPPFQIDQQGVVGGFATKILQAAIKETTLTSRYQILSWSRAYNLTQTRPNTCIYSIARTAQREQMFYWVDTITQTDSHFIGLTDRTDIQIRSIDDAKKYNVAVLKDDVTHQLLLSHGFKEYKNLYVVNNTRSLLKLLTLRNNIDLILADNLTVTYRALYNNMAPDTFKIFLQVNKQPLNFYLACNLESDSQGLKQLEQGFLTIKQNGLHDKLSNEWKQLNSVNEELIK